MSVNSTLAQVQMLMDQEQYDNAYDLMQKSYEEYKDDSEFLEKFALLAKTMEKDDEAVKYWEELVSVNPNSLVAYSELLDHYMNSDKYKYYVTRAKYKILNQKVSQSIDDYKKAIAATQEEKDIVNARFLLAKSYEYVGKIQDAIDEYFRIIEHKDDIAIYLKLADLYSESGDRFSAINILERGVKAFPEVTDLSEYLAALYIKEGKYEEALKHAKNIFTKIKAYLMKGENEKAYELLMSVEDKENGNFPALMAEYYFNKKDWDNCSQYIEKFNRVSPQNPLVYQMKALVCDAKKDLYGYHYNMGRCYSYKQDYELAMAEYLNAHRVDGTKPDAIKEIIKINEAKGDKTSLIEFYEKLSRTEPDNPTALMGLGDMYADMYEFRDAISYYEKLLKTGNYPNELNYKLGICYEKTKDFGTAKEYYEKYISKAPLSPDIEKLKEKVSKMSNGNQATPTANEEGLIDKIMRIFGK